MKKICVITGSRSEYGLLYYLLKALKLQKNIELLIVVTGSHLSKKYGSTYKNIEQDGFQINYKIKILGKRDDADSISKSTALGLLSFSKVFKTSKPDLIIILGDRYEMLAASIAALYSNVHIAHIHGGEVTEGSIDDSIRHSITKMSSIHFTANKKYRDRVIQLGEHPSRVFNVGGLGVDAIKKTKIYSKSELEKKFKFKFKKNNLLITFHPVTVEKRSSPVYINELLKSLNKLKNTNLFFTMPNADKDNLLIVKKIREFQAKNLRNVFFYKSLGIKNYYSFLTYIDGVLGNSSSGIIEAPSFKIGTINIGDRQKGRLFASSIISCKPRKEEIDKAIKKLYSKSFQDKLKTTVNPYENKDTVKKIVNIINKYKIPKNTNKFFYDK